MGADGGPSFLPVAYVVGVYVSVSYDWKRPEDLLGMFSEYRGVEMLISLDLLNHMQRAIYDGGSPAQLCVMRRMGTDSDYIFRVRHGEAHLDYPVSVPLLDSADRVAAVVNFDEVTSALVAMSKLVVKPGEIPLGQLSQSYNGGYGRVTACVLPPVV